MQQWVLDTETYRNYHLVAVKNIATSDVRLWHPDEDHLQDCKDVIAFLEDPDNEIITFNGLRYDLPLLAYSLSGKTNAEIKAASDAIIKEGLTPFHFARRFPGIPLDVNHIDLMEPAPGVGVSLKSYGARLHCPKLQDLPIEPDATLTVRQKLQIEQYCENDLDTTIALYRAITPRIDLRREMSRQYNVDLRSKSDAQIAETVIKQEVGRRLGKKIECPSVAPGTTYRYQPPDFINFQTPTLQHAFDVVRSAKYVISEKGGVEMPPEIAELKIAIGESVYQMGIGGLHSTESSVARHSDAARQLIDADVASYYPSIILRTGLKPEHMGAAFLQVYEGIFRRRIEAKRSGDKVVADTLKIVMNGSYGKFGSKWSALYSPRLLIQTTLTGQLALLQLIESLELAGIPVVSANTDGIVLYAPRHKIEDAKGIIGMWEWFSGFEMEFAEYAALYSKDVNNYIALKCNGDIKAKGIYADAGLTKNPTADICVEAVKAHLLTGQSIASAIESCTDLTRFIVVRAVKGGGQQGEQYLGKTVRWYYSTQCRALSINYRSNGNTVAKSQGAMPVMQLPDSFPDDIDYAVYIEEANKILKDIGL